MRLLIDAVRRVYAALLLLLPSDIRARHGDEMRHTSRQIVEDTLHRRGPFAALAAGAAECLDVIATAARASRRAPSEFRQDLAYAWRLMWTRRAVTATIVGTLSVGIGATTAVFTVVDALLLRPLPYAEPDRLVQLVGVGRAGTYPSLSPRDFHDITTAMPSLASAAAFTDQSANLTGRADPERVDTALVTWNFFDVVGAPLAVGRSFDKTEGEAGRERVVVISHALWQRRFGGRVDILGRDILLDGYPHTIVGVAAASMTLPGRPHIWRPLVFTSHQLDQSQRGARWIAVVARLKPGVDPGRADAEARAVAAQLEAQFQRTNRGRSASVRQLQQYLVGDSQRGLLALFAAVAAVLLTCCANVANLLLARASARANEMTIRMALGAGRGRLLRQCLTENLLLTTVAAGVGLALAAWTTRLATAFLPQALPRAEEIAVDWRVAGFAVAIAIALAIVLGTVAALGLRKGAMIVGVRTIAPGARSVRRTLVVAEVAMALVLLTGAGLFVRSLINLYGVSPGFDAGKVLTFAVTMPEAPYSTPDHLVRFIDRLQSDLTSRPGIERAAGIFGLPLTQDFGASTSFNRVGRAVDPDNEPTAALRIATPHYFQTMRIPLRAGRDFNEHDTTQTPGVAIINETVARRYWPGENPIGQSLRVHVGLSSVAQTPREVVGIVGDVRYSGLDAEAPAEIYVPQAQHPVDALVIAVRTAGDPHLAIDDARAVLQRLDPNMPMAHVATMEEIVAESVAARRFSLALLTAFAGCAVLLASIGIYGVLSYTVTQRTREIGVRMAMGAPRGHVLRLVVGEGFTLVIVGLAVGGVATLAVTRFVKGLLYEVQPSDPLTLALVASVLLAVAVTASYLPARRAAAVDPVSALRTE